MAERPFRVRGYPTGASVLEEMARRSLSLLLHLANPGVFQSAKTASEYRVRFHPSCDFRNILDAELSLPATGSFRLGPGERRRKRAGAVPLRLAIPGTRLRTC